MTVLISVMKESTKSDQKVYLLFSDVRTIFVSILKRMKNILDFLGELKENNNREWFEANKERYKALQEQFNGFTQQLIDGITIFDPAVKGVSVKDCTYRIYRDVRFSPNKEPYKTHMGAYICPGGKKSGMAGYYFHLEPGNAILAVGLHCPEPNVVKSVRDEIFDNGVEFEKAIKEAKGFIMDFSSKLQRVPRGFPADTSYAEYLKLKEFDLIAPLAVDENLLENVLMKFKTAKHFNDLLNRAVKYAREEM